MAWKYEEKVVVPMEIDYSFLDYFSTINEERLKCTDFYNEGPVNFEENYIAVKPRAEEGLWLSEGVVSAQEIIESIVERGAKLIWENDLKRKLPELLASGIREFASKALFYEDIYIQSVPEASKNKTDTEPMSPPADSQIRCSVKIQPKSPETQGISQAKNTQSSGSGFDRQGTRRLTQSQSSIHQKNQEPGEGGPGIAMPEPFLIEKEEGEEVQWDEEEVMERGKRHIEAKLEEEKKRIAERKKEILRQQRLEMSKWSGSDTKPELTYDFNGNLIVVPPQSKNNLFSSYTGNIVTQMPSLLTKKEGTNVSEAYLEKILMLQEEEERKTTKERKRDKERENLVTTPNNIAEFSWKYQDVDVMRALEPVPGVSMKMGERHIEKKLEKMTVKQVQQNFEARQIKISRKEYEEMVLKEDQEGGCINRITPPEITEKNQEPDSQTKGSIRNLSMSKIKIKGIGIKKSNQALGDSSLSSEDFSQLKAVPTTLTRKKTKSKLKVSSQKNLSLMMLNTESLSSMDALDLGRRNEDTPLNQSNKTTLSPIMNRKSLGSKAMRLKTSQSTKSLVATSGHTDSKTSIKMSDNDLFNVQVLTGRKKAITPNDEFSNISTIMKPSPQKGLGTSRKFRERPNLFYFNEPVKLPPLPQPGVGKVIGHGL